MRTKNVTALALAGAAAILLGPGPSRAETVDASSTTMVIARQQRHDTEVDRTIPIFEILSLSARDMRGPMDGDLGIELSTWGAYDFGVPRFVDGEPAEHRASGDLHIAYAQGSFADRQLRLRLGRQVIATGASRFTHLDGGDMLLRLPAGFGVSGYVGVPVSPRFGARTGYLRDSSGNVLRSIARAPVAGDLAAGGRVSWLRPGLGELGFSYAFVDDSAHTERSDVAADLRITPAHRVSLRGYGLFSVQEERLAEVDAAAEFEASRQLRLALTYKRFAPDLFLSRGSILSVFAEDSVDEAGAAVHWTPYRAFALDLEYDVSIEDSDNLAHHPRAKGTWHLGKSSLVGIEGSLLEHPENGYFEGRVFGSHRVGALRGTLDLIADSFDEPINGEDFSFQAVATAGLDFAKGWTALVSGIGETTPFFERRFEVMAKLAYNQTYRYREVR